MLYPSWQRLLLCGLALGAVLAAKFSAVFLLPVAAFLLLAGVRWPPVPNSGRKQTLLDPYFSGKGSPAQNASGIQSSVSEQPAGRIGRKDRCPCGSGKKYKNCHGADSEESASLFARSGLGRKALLAMSAFAAMCLVAYVMIQAVYFFPSGPFLYAKCMRLVNADHNPAYLQFLAGELRNNSPSYFAVAYLLKEPIAGIILTGIGFVVLVRSKSIPFIAKLFLIVPPATLFVAVSALADNIGIRYIIPVFPFLYLLGGLGLATLIQAGTKIKWTRYAAIILCGWIVLAAAGVYPDHLPYFNEAACLLDKPGQIGLDGGTRCGPTWLDDSNVDWGEGLKQLKAWLDRNANGRTVKLAISTSFPPDAYDIKYDRLEHSTLVKEPAPGLYAVSAHLVARMPAYPLASDWLRRIRPMAIVAHSLCIYDIPQTSTRP
jgi:hypothetical protein